MRRSATGLLQGTVVAAVAAGLSSLLALAGFRRPYYLSVFLPVSMLCCLLVAWFLHLRGDRFLGSPSAMRGEDGKGAWNTVPGAAENTAPGAAAREAAPRRKDRNESGPPDILLQAAEGRAEGPIRRQGGAPASPKAMRALLWAAAELAVAATLLYFLWGVGASYR